MGWEGVRGRNAMKISIIGVDKDSKIEVISVE